MTWEEAQQKDHIIAFNREEIETHNDNAKWDFFNALFTLAKIPVLAHWELPNQYLPSVYVTSRLQSPWWLVKTPYGLLKIGRRKRVWSLHWDDTKLRNVITEDDTTKDRDMVHAWTEEKLLEYLKELRTQLTALEPELQTA